ncbi:MFS transporter [Streptomyces sp. NPDC090493]|uniref:MFS transporter n=1 Tax=Streptomyces sp. NPDC090493 TaxID=3365964 RepID=UPI0038247F8D
MAQPQPRTSRRCPVKETPTDREDKARLRHVALSSFLGTTVEHYDFLLYSTAAALVFNEVFFTNLTPLIGTIVSLATLAAGYLARVVGAILFGHYGDRLGRKNVMLTTMIVMGVSSGLIGCLPTYDTVGAVAALPLVFLRLVQGLAVGGEFGGAVLMTAEHARTGRRGLMSSAASMGQPSGSVLASGSMALVTLLPEDQLLSWGWRIPFLASFLLLAVGLYFRLRVTESPVFLEQRAKPRNSTPPILSLLRRYPGRVGRAVGFQIGAFCGQGVFGVFVVSYAPTIGYERSTALLALLLGALGSALMTPVYAAWSDRVGRKPFAIAGSLGTAVSAYPGFLLINHGSPPVFVLTVACFLTFVMTCMGAVAPAMLSELFPTEVRYTAVSTSYQLAATVGAGFGPLIAASLLAARGGDTNTGLVSLFLVIVGVFGAVCAWTVQETHRYELTDDDSVENRVPAVTSVSVQASEPSA